MSELAQGVGSTGGGDWKHVSPMAISAAVDDAGLSSQEFRVLAHVCRRAGDMQNGRGCDASVASIARACRLKRDTVRQAVANLAALGWLRREMRQGFTAMLIPAMGQPTRIPKPEGVAKLGEGVAKLGEPTPTPKQPGPYPETGEGGGQMGGGKGKPSRETEKGEKSPPPSELLPADRVQAELAKVFPNAPRHLTGAEHHDLFDALRTLDELTAEDWQAIAAWMRAPERIRGRKLWPRDRAEFIRNAGQAIENIRQWWKTSGRTWANRAEPVPATSWGQEDGAKPHAVEKPWPEEFERWTKERFPSTPARVLWHSPQIRQQWEEGREEEREAAAPVATESTTSRTIQAGNRRATETML